MGYSFVFCFDQERPEWLMGIYWYQMRKRLASLRNNFGIMYYKEKLGS